MKRVLLVLLLSLGVSHAQTVPIAQGNSISPELLTKANAGDVRSQLLVGAAYATGSGTRQDYGEALLWFRKAASQGSAEAETILGESYYQGRGVPQDNVQAANWYLKAAAQGNVEAEYNVGLLYHDGLGIPQDFASAARWIREAADQGLPEAQFDLGKLYANGQGVPQNDTQSAACYRKAAEQGNSQAQLAIGLMYDLGKGVPLDNSQAALWYRKAAEQGAVLAQLYLGEAYASGSGVPQDYPQSIVWFSRAADQGLAQAQDHLGYSYANGFGVPKDYARAAAWFRKAAEQGDAKAQHNLAVLYTKGQGVPRDRAQAIAWESRANEQSHSAPVSSAPQPQEEGRYGEAPVLAQIRAEQARQEQERPARELHALTIQNELDRQRAIQQYRALLAGLQGDPTPEQQVQLDRLKSIINLGNENSGTGAGNEGVEGDAAEAQAGTETPADTVIKIGSKAEVDEKPGLGPTSALGRGVPPINIQVASPSRKIAVQGTYQTSVNCPQDGFLMTATGMSKIDINGHKLCEYAHQVTPPYTPPQPYDPLNPQPYKAPHTIKHTVWVSCN